MNENDLLAAKIAEYGLRTGIHQYLKEEWYDGQEVDTLTIGRKEFWNLWSMVDEEHRIRERSAYPEDPPGAALYVEYWCPLGLVKIYPEDP